MDQSMVTKKQLEPQQRFDVKALEVRESHDSATVEFYA
jgi:hypothetical protein